MTTMLERTLRRELRINDRPYTLTITPSGFTLAVKRRRQGIAIEWRDLIERSAPRGDDPMAAHDHAAAGALIPET